MLRFADMVSRLLLLTKQDTIPLSAKNATVLLDFLAGGSLSMDAWLEVHVAVHVKLGVELSLAAALPPAPLTLQLPPRTVVHILKAMYEWGSEGLEELNEAAGS